MLLTVTSTASSATDLGYLLHKHPDRVQNFDLPFGRAVAYYPEAGEQRCTFALQVDVDPIALLKRRGKQLHPATIAGYVNDRPYAVGSMLAVAIGRVLSTALRGRCDARPELVAETLPLTVRVPALAARPSRVDDGGPELVERLFGALGWHVQVEAEPYPVPEWSDSPYVTLTLSGEQRLSDALNHLYVLLPVLDGSKHYYVSPDEVDKLIRRGEGWLAAHPERDLITRRYLLRGNWADDALARLNAVDDVEGETPEVIDDESPTPLKQQRLDAVLGVLREAGVRSVVDVGCGEGVFLRALLDDPSFTRILGVDVSARELDRAERRLNLDRRSDTQRERIHLRQSSVTYRDDGLQGFDALLLVEVVEHVELSRLDSLEVNVFAHARQKRVIVTTPNAEYNAVYGLDSDEMRHPDHRFEWTRGEFREWAGGVAERHGYAVEFRDVGTPDEELGPPTQLALFTRLEGASA
ncbi:MAG: 3' terminal RNA ribose 2'-O-methyltransferase Hen1 [Tessaracoccus sp.]